MSASLADLVTVAVAAMLVWWWVATAGNEDRGIGLSRAELAYARSGATLAVLSSLAWLRATGTISNAWNKKVVAVSPVPAGTEGLDQAIHAALRSSAPWSDLMLDSRVADELNQVRQRLIRYGWLLRERQIRSMRALAIIPAAASLGFLLMRDEHGKLPWRQATEFILIAGAVLIFVTTSERTHAGRRLLRRHRGQHNRLRSRKRRRSWAGCSADEVALAVALFGSSALWSFDPDFAVKAGLPLESDTWWLPGTGGPTPGN